MDAYCKVLIVDDEILARQGIKHLFDWESEGFTLIGEASNGKEALELIAANKPHIIITDIVMPIMDGEELARQVKANYPEIEMVVLSSFSEFEYVRSTFQSGAADYILKPKLDAAQLLQTLKKIAGRIPAIHSEAFSTAKAPTIWPLLEKLIDGFAITDPESEIREMLPHTSFVLLGIAHPGESGMDSAQIYPWLETHLLANLSGPECTATWDFPQQGGITRVLFNFAPPYELQLRAHIIRLEEALMAFPTPVTAACSSVFRAIADLNEVYHQEVPRLLDSYFFQPERRLFLAGIGVRERVPAEMFDANAFNQELNHHDFEAAFGRLRTFFDDLQVTPGVGIHDFKSFLGHQVFAVILALVRLEYPASKLDERKYEYFRDIHESRHVHQAKDIVMRFLAEAESCVAKRNRPTGNQAIHKLLNYIQEHYAEPLNLTEVAHHFHFNPSYLSNYFATHNKEGFSEYLNRVRIDKACELLKNSDMSISEVSGQVGYSDPSYFTKVFRKLKNISPSQYRKYVQEGQDPE